LGLEGSTLTLMCPRLVSAVFYTLPCVGDFIVDISVGSPQADIRNKAVEQFNLLSKTEFTPTENTGHQQSAHQFILQTLLKARLPFWVSSSKVRGASYRLATYATHLAYIWLWFLNQALIRYCFRAVLYKRVV